MNNSKQAYYTKLTYLFYETTCRPPINNKKAMSKKPTLQNQLNLIADELIEEAVKALATFERKESKRRCQDWLKEIQKIG